MLKLLVGLGNPGDRYINTRHNIGFEIIDGLSQLHKTECDRTGFHGTYVKLHAPDLLLFKPTTYMNNSGIAVAEISRFFKINSTDIFVFHDDLDFNIGRVKVKKGGSSGGHNGLKSLDTHVGTDYWRIRIGISKPENKHDVSNYVLQKFTVEQSDVIDLVIKKIVSDTQILLNHGAEKFLSRFYS